MASVDVIVPCYRYGRFLRQCVTSVLEQSGVDVRVLILDDASPDDTAQTGRALQMQDARVSFVRHSTNHGHIRTYNKGLGWASADYLLLLSADDYLLPGALHRATALMTSHPEVGFTFGTAIELAGNGMETPVPPHGKVAAQVMTGDEFLRLSGPHNIVPTPTAVVRTTLQHAVGGYRPDLPHAGDMEMWLRLAARSSVGFIRDPQAVYRRHSSNMSLAYQAQGFLPDLQQRKAALDHFFQNAGASPGAEQLREKLSLSLAVEALRFASAAFNNADIDLSEQLSNFALTICPRVATSLAWMKLRCKRRVGYRRWSALRPLVSREGRTEQQR